MSPALPGKLSDDTAGHGSPPANVAERRDVSAAPAAFPLPAVRTGPATVDLELSYRPVFEEDEEGVGLGVYLDGEQLTRLSPAFGDSFEGVLELPAGRHRLVMAQEEHTRRKRGWHHFSRVSPAPLEFEVPAGGLVKVEAGFDPPWRARRSAGPLFLNVQIDNRIVDAQRNVGEPVDEWPPICEDLEAMKPHDGRVPYEIRKGLETCVRWSSLWPEETEGPSREELLTAIAASIGERR